MKEARLLTQKGIREFQLIAQDLTYYGRDIYHKAVLPELVERLSDMSAPVSRPVSRARGGVSAQCKSPEPGAGKLVRGGTGNWRQDSVLLLAGESGPAAAPKAGRRSRGGGRGAGGCAAAGVQARCRMCGRGSAVVAGNPACRGSGDRQQIGRAHV